jgi:ketosteroid isomerase-like protein
MSDDDLAELEEANSRFYRAFERLDLAEMDGIWAHTDRVQCIHPGWPLIVGWPAVRTSWESIFANTTEMRFTIGDVRVGGGPHVAWVTCTENILSQVSGRVSVTSLLATNVFERAPHEWKMVLHHASHILATSANAS